MERCQLEKILKLKIKSNDISTAIDILNNEIKNIFIEKIKEYNINFKFTDTITLANNIEKYLKEKEINLFKKYFILMNEENHPIYELSCLVEIYNELKEGEKNVRF